MKGLAILLLFVTAPAFAQLTEFTATGEYQGKNIFIQNPLSKDKMNFCTTEVFLNGKLVTTAPKTSAFAIDLSGLKVGDPVFIKVAHREGCAPKIINPQVLRSKSKFEMLSAYADGLSIHWATTGELPNGKFFVEHYKNKKWVNVAVLNGKGNFDANQYTVEPEHHTGDNKYRLKYLQSDGRVFYSRVFDYFNDAEPISFSPALVEDKITLSRESDYAVVDSYGNQIAQGKGSVINLNALKEGLYYLYVDNREEKFVKK